MYRFFARSTIIRPAFQRLAKKPFSTQTFRAQPTVSKVALGTGLASTLIAYNLLSEKIENETDEKKIEEAKKEAEATADPSKVEQGKKEAIGKANVKTKIPPEEATPETRTEMDESQLKKGRSTEKESKEDEYKDEASSHEGAAYNPETGEINWDCPCLGGMAHGPCGEEFKEAFACFIYSETEPRGIDCIKKFENMRSCFKQHPEHYKEELDDDEKEVPAVEADKVKENKSEKDA